MFKQAFPLALVLALSACDGSSPNPVNGTRETTADAGDGGDGDETTVNGIPEVLAQNVTGIGLNDGGTADTSDDVLTVEGLGLDDSPFTATYVRNVKADVPGYQAYSQQTDRLDRIYVAITATSPNGEVRAGSVSDGGQINRFFRGNFYERLVPLTRPEVTDANGQVSYAGYYAGVSNLSDLDQDLALDLQLGDPVEARPRQPRQTEGKVFLNVDFSDNKVNGTIYDRQFTDGAALPSLALIEGGLDDNGEFAGDVEFSGRPDLGKQGDHGGIIGGENASAVAGVIHLDNIFNPDDADPLDDAFDREVGSFVLPRCGTADAPDICNGLSDLE